MAAPRILVVYQSTEGHTARVAARLADVAAAAGAAVEVRTAADAPPPDGFDGVLAGGSVHQGRHGAALVHWLRSYAAALRAVPTGVFQVSLSSANPDATHTAQAQEMLQRLLRKTGARADLTACFAGALAYTRYGWLKRRLMRSIARREHADVDTSRDHVYTDWAAVERFAHDLLDRVRASTAAG